MKYLLFVLLTIILCISAEAQKRGDPKIYYWTIWFKTTAYPANFDSAGKGHDWVQSFSDPREATSFYQSLKSTGKFLIRRQYLAKVDTTSVYIDSFNMNTRKYSFEYR